MRENTQKINYTEFKTKCTTYCPIGKDYYTADIEIVIKNQKKIPDYEVIDDFLRVEMNGKVLTHEDLNRVIYDKIYELFEPEYLRVDVISNTIMNIKTTIESEDN